MEKTVLIITSTSDRTVDYICDKYKDINFKRLNVDRFAEYNFNITDSSGWVISNAEWNKPLSWIDVYSIYYRKPTLPSLIEFKEKFQPMIKKDIITVIEGIVNSFEGKVLTKPSVLHLCENKIYQLKYAQTHHLKMPKSIISNDSATSLFLKTIIKPISVGKIIYNNDLDIFQTCLFSDNLSDISLTPSYFQEYVPKQYEVRVTAIDGKLFSVKIESSDKVDWRSPNAVNKYSIIELPEQIRHQCFSILNDFGLVFGAFDFIVSPEDEWFFLEVNPNGQWQWLEQELDLKISDSIIEYLIR